MKRFGLALLCLTLIELGLVRALNGISPGRPPERYFWTAIAVSAVGAVWGDMRSRKRALRKPAQDKNQLWIDPDF
jgi:hypothetical protein